MTSFSKLLRQGERFARRGGSLAVGLIQRVRNANPAPKPDMDDVTLARKVETIVFRDADSPKGSIDVNAVDGVVHLHGEVKRPEQIEAIEAAVRKIPEVRGVENLLHLPKTQAPSAPGAQQRRMKKATRSKPRTEGRFNREAETPGGEPKPSELAAARAGRKAAPLGAEAGTEPQSAPPAGAGERTGTESPSESPSAPPAGTGGLAGSTEDKS